MEVAEYVTNVQVMPQRAFERTWESIVSSSEIKQRLLNSALLSLELRPKLPFPITALHGLFLLYGPPGTGKTTLARGLPQQISQVGKGRHCRLIEINPHGLMSVEHGRSQHNVFALLCDYIPSLADDGQPTVVVLDEVESMAVARSAASLSANPADVHRSTDAVLAALDRNASDHPHLITVATSNFTEALDEAFLSRADVAIKMPLPDADAIATILKTTLRDFATAYPALAKLADAAGVAAIAHHLVGADGRQVRKLVTEAMAQRRETVLDPALLTLEDIKHAADAGAHITAEGPRHAAA